MADSLIAEFLARRKNPNRFPTKHPYANNADGSISNVVLGGFGINGRQYVIPTMVEGKQLTNNEAVDVARNHGLDKYPSFASERESSEYAAKIHSLVDGGGNIWNPLSLNKTNPAWGSLMGNQGPGHGASLVDTISRLRRRSHGGQ